MFDSRASSGRGSLDRMGIHTHAQSPAVGNLAAVSLTTLFLAEAGSLM